MGLILFIMLQPDFGSVVIIATCIAAMILSAAYPCASFYHYGAMVWQAPWRLWKQLPTKTGNLVLDPFDEKNSDYQLVAAFVALPTTRQKWFGVGYGESIQKLSHYQAHTDFTGDYR